MDLGEKPYDPLDYENLAKSVVKFAPRPAGKRDSARKAF